MPLTSGRVRWERNGAAGRWIKNLELYELASAKAFLFRNSGWAGLYFYFEFENMADPEADPSLPTFGLDGGMESGYYAGLADASVRDFARVAAHALPGTASAGVYARTNLLDVFAQIRTGAGVHGKTFSEAAASRVYAAALVVAPDKDDWTQDFILSRVNFEPAEQMDADANEAARLKWELKFEL